MEKNGNEKSKLEKIGNFQLKKNGNLNWKKMEILKIF